MTGFRVALGGAQALYNVRPDLTCLGKVIGGGLPVGAYGGRREIMSKVAPLGEVYQAGTLSGNPMAMSAGIKTLEILQNKGVYDQLEAKGKMLEEAIQKRAKAAGLEYSELIGRIVEVAWSRWKSQRSQPIDPEGTPRG